MDQMNWLNWLLVFLCRYCLLTGSGSSQYRPATHPCALSRYFFVILVSCFSVPRAHTRVRPEVPPHGQPAAPVPATAAAGHRRLALPQGVRPSLRVHPPAAAQLHQHTLHLPPLIQLQQEPTQGTRHPLMLDIRKSFLCFSLPSY